MQLKKDYKKTKKAITEINPDFIINTHYELLNAIPRKLLNRTIMHFHTNFNIVKTNWSYKKIFNKYKNKIYKFVWLTKATKEEAIKHGYTNSTSIYNSVRINSSKKAKVINNKNLIFLGRISKEKRIDIILNIFDEISKNNPEWTLSIYGIGNLNATEEQIVQKNKNIKFMGPTNDLEKVFLQSSININTSDYEGFSMTILEANEFGVPTICFEFGESVYEEVINNKTGVIVEKNNFMPSESINKTFSVENTGEYIVQGYTIVLEDVINELTRRDQKEVSHKQDRCFKRLGWKPEGFMKIKEKNLLFIG